MSIPTITFPETEYEPLNPQLAYAEAVNHQPGDEFIMVRRFHRRSTRFDGSKRPWYEPDPIKHSATRWVTMRRMDTRQMVAFMVQCGSGATKRGALRSMYKADYYLPSEADLRLGIALGYFDDGSEPCR